MVVNRAQKEEDLWRLISSPVVDLWKLREHALTDGGLLNDSIRQRAWPLLVGLHATELDRGRKQQHPTTTAALPNNEYDCIDKETIDLDVTRCTWHLLTGNQRVQRLQMACKRQRRVAKLVRKKQAKLGRFIARTLVQGYPTSDEKLRYYQGYHDIACIILSTLGGSGLTGPWQQHPSLLSLSSSSSPGMDLATAVLFQLSTTHLREYLRPDFQSLQSILSLSVYPLLALWDRPVHDHLLATGLSPWFALPWMITWFSHDLRDTALVKRIFDFLMVSHPLMPLYLSLAMLLHPFNRQCILNTEMDLGCLHQTLASLPRHTSSFGWKYHPESDGYVSCEEDTDHDTTTSTGDDDSLAMENAVVQQVLVWSADHPSRNKRVSSPLSLETASTTSSSMEGSVVDETKAKVPLQALLDQAVTFMQILPPRQIIHLATRYHGPDQVYNFLQVTHQNVPPWLSEEMPASSWRLAAKAVSPFYNNNNKKSNNNNHVSASQPCVLASDLLQQDPAIVRRIVQESAYSKAVIASGFGISRRQQRAMRQRRKRVMGAILLVAIFVCLVMGALTTTNFTSPFITLLTRIIATGSLPSSTDTAIIIIIITASCVTILAMMVASYYIAKTTLLLPKKTQNKQQS